MVFVVDLVIYFGIGRNLFKKGFVPINLFE